MIFEPSAEHPSPETETPLSEKTAVAAPSAEYSAAEKETGNNVNRNSAATIIADRRNFFVLFINIIPFAPVFPGFCEKYSART